MWLCYLNQKSTSCDLDIALGHIAILINCEALSAVMVLYNQALRSLKLKQFDSETQWTYLCTSCFYSKLRLPL